MSKIFLLTISAPSSDTKNPGATQKIYLDTKGSTVKAALKALPHHSYRLVDAQTMALIKDQYVIRKGKQLQVWVDDQIVVELEDFFEISEQTQHTTADLPTYVVQQGSAEAPTYGLINAHTPLQYIADQTSVVWAPGVQLAQTLDPVALGLNPAALSSMFSGTLLSAGAAAVGIATLATSDSNDSKSGSETSSVLRGSVSLGTLITSNLTLTAYKSDGTKLQETAVNDDGSYTLTLNGYTGPLMLKLSGTATYNNESGGTATFDASVTTLRAVVNAVAGSMSAHLNPLTEIAAKKLVVIDNNGNPTLPGTATIATMSAAIGKLFLGESKDVTQVEADTTTDGGTTSNALGRFLAIVAAAEQKDDLTTQEVIDKLVAGINTEGTAFSGVEAKNLLLSAAAQAVGNESLKSEDVRSLLKSIMLDTSAKAEPQVLISADKGILGPGATCTVTFTFNQDPGTSFDLGDVTVTGGTLSDFAVSANDANIYTAKFTPAPGGTAASFTIAADKFTAKDTNASNKASDTLTLLVDTVKPATPNASLNVDSSNGGTGLDTDGITNSGAITAPANIEKNASLAYRVKKDAGAFSDWASTYKAPATDGSADGAYTVEVRQTDKAGNVSSTQTINFTLDSTKPVIPNVVLSSDSSNSANPSYSTDRITNSGAITAPVNAEAGALVEYRIQKASDAFSDWNTTYTAPTNEGNYTVEVRQTDKAGNVSSTQTFNFTLDTTAPSIATTAFNLTENNAANALVSSLQASDVNGPVTFSSVLQGADAAKFSIDAQGNLRVRDAKNFESKDDQGGDGVYALTVSGTDVAGNSFTQDITVTLNNLNEAPVLRHALANQTFLAGGSTNSFTLPANSFTEQDVGDTVTYSATLSDGSALPSWLTFDAASRTFSGTPASNGSITVKVTATDNASTPLSTSANFVLTSVFPPTVSSFKVTDNNAGGGSNKAVGKQGDTLTFELTMSEAVTVSGSPTISVKVGGTDVTANYSSGSGSNVLLFTATAPAGDGTVAVFNSFSVNGGSVIGITSGQAWANSTVADAAYSLDNTAPVWGSSTLSVTEGGLADITSAVLAITETQASGANLKFSVTSQSQGNMQVNGVNSSTFTLQDVLDGKVKFLHNGGEVAPAITLSAFDGVNSASKTLSITFTNADDSPVISSALTLSIREGGDVALVVPNGAVTDVDSSDANVSLEVSNLSSNGKFYLASDSSKTALTSFSLADAKAGNIRFLHDGSETAPTFSITAISGTASSATLAGLVTYTPVDDAPVMLNPSLSITEGQSLTIDRNMLGITDPDTTDSNVKITATSQTNGNFTLNGSFATAFTLDDVANSRVKFVHDGSEQAPLIRLKVNDSTNAATATDMPVTVTFTNTPDPTVLQTPSFSVTEGGSLLLNATHIPASDPDTDATRIELTLSNITGGRFEKVSATGISLQSFLLSELQQGQIRFVHDGSETAPAFSVSAKNLDGGSTTATVDSQILYNRVNDLPTIFSPSLTITQGTPLVVTQAMLGISDPDNTNAEVKITVNAFANGSFRFNNGDTPLTTFTLKQVADNAITVVDDGTGTKPVFSISVTDLSNTVVGPVNVRVNLNTSGNNAPLVDLSNIVVQDGQELTLTTAILKISDVDTPANLLTIDVSNLQGVRFTKSGTDQSRFTLQDVNDGTIKLSYDSSVAAPKFDIAVTDNAPQTVNVRNVVLAITNKPPQIGTPQLAVTEGMSVVLTQEMLAVFSADNSAADVKINVSNVVGGYFSKTGSVDILTNFTLADVQASLIQFTHDGSETAPSFDLNANNLIGRTSASVRATPVFTRANDAPQFSSGQANNSVTVDENSSAVVFTAPLATDVDSASLSYLLSGVDAAKFSIDADRKIRFSAAPDFEMPSDSDGNNSYLLNIEATDGSLKATQSLVVYVRNVNDAPRIAAPNFALTERGSTVLTKAALGITDQDNADSNLTVTASGITGGRVTVLGQTANTFTVSQLAAGQVVFVHDGLSGTPTLSIRVSDGSNSTAVTPVTITYNAIDDAPVINSVSLSVLQGAALTVTPQMFNVTDSDTAAANVVFNLSGVQGGVFKLSGTDANSFTLADLASNRVTFTHDNTGTSPAFTFSVSDGTNTLSAQSVTGTLSLTNVKPLVQAAQFSLTEATDYTSVTLTKSMLGISDQDNTDADVTINVSSVSGGNFQKSGSTVTSFTLADVANGLMSFRYLYGSGTPAFSLQAKDSVNDYATAVSSVVTLANAPYNVIMGDGSGAGGLGARFSGFALYSGRSAVTDNDTLAGTVQADVIFGDGSGGGAGGSIGSALADTVYVEGGSAGSGADQINAGGGDDIVFGDGFSAHGQARSASGTDGGYGGGGGGGSNLNGRTASKGGFGAGAGGVGSASSATSLGGTTTIHHAGTLDIAGGAGGGSGTSNSGGGGAGVGNSSTGVIANAITQTQYQTVFNDVSRGAGADARVFNQAMGTGADVIDAGDGNDWVFAGGGNDTITGGKGGDRIFTGFGADTVNYTLADLDGNTDFIADFNPNAGDKLKFDFIPPGQVKQYLSMQSWGAGQRLLVDKDGLAEFANSDQVIEIGYASTASISSVTNGAAYTITINYKNATNVSQTKTYTRTANTPSALLAATNLTEIMQSLVTQINADASLTNTYATFEGGTFQFARINPSNTQTQPVISFSSNIQPVVSALNNSTQPDSVTFNALLLSGAISLGTGTLPALSPELNLVEGQTLTLNTYMLGLDRSVDTNTTIEVRNVRNGYFALTGTHTAIASFTVAQLNSGVVFVHDRSEAAPQFELRSDALVLGTFPSTYVTANINFQNVNDAPVFQNSRTTKIINAGESLRLTEADLGNLSDPDTADPALVFNVNLPTNSLKLVNADTGDLSVTSFTLADVKNNKISLQALNSISLGTYQATVSCVDGHGGTANLNLGIAVDMPGRQKSYIKSLVVIMNSMEPQVMTTDDLKIVFPDSSASDLSIHVDVSSGLKFLSSSTLTEINQFTYQDVIDGKISIQRKTGNLSIEGSLVRLRLEDQSDTTQLTDYYDSIVYVGTSSILYADVSSSVLAVSSGTQTTLSWEAMGMRVKSAMIGSGPPSNLYSYSNSIGQLVGNTVFLNNAASPSNPFATSFNLIPTPNVSWGSLDFSNSSGTRYGWARNGMYVKYVVDYAQADAPVVMSSGFKAIRGQTSLITPADLDIRDADSAASQIIINLRNVKNGRIELVNAPNLAANTFTMQDVFDGNVLFRHDGSNLSPSYELAVTNPNMHSGVNLFFTKVEGRLISKGIDLAPNPDWLNLGASLLSMDVDLDTSPENVTVSLSNIQGMSGYNPSSSPLVFTWRDYTERLYFRGVQVDTNGVQMTATVNDGNSSVSAQITVSTSYENQTDSGLSATMYLNEEGGRNLVNPSLFKYTKISQVQLATFNVDSIFGMHLELLSNPGVKISTFDYRQLDSGQLVAVYGGGDVLPQLSLSINQSFAAEGSTGSYVSPSRSVNVVIDRISKDDAPVFNPAVSIGAGQSRVLYSREFNVMDAESYASGDYSGLIFKIKETEGVRLERSGNPGTALTQFTYSELDQGLIRLVSLGDAYPVLRMTISNPNGSSESQIVDTHFAYQKGVVNDAPVFSPVAASTIDQGGSLLITEQMLGIKDIDSSRNKVTLTNTNSSNGVFKIADHIASSFTLAQVKAGLVSFVHDGSSTAPVMKLKAEDELSSRTPPVTTDISLTLNPLASPLTPDLSDALGALIIFGDGSGSGGSGARYTGISRSRTGLNGAGNNDTLDGSSKADVIFGDGSGGGEGAASSGVGIGGGSAGSGDDIINAGDGNDIVFGDGFWGDNCTQFEKPGSGGYGGGGGGGMLGSLGSVAGSGGIGAGDGKSFNAAETSPTPTLSFGASSTLFNAGGTAQTGLLGTSGGGTHSGGGGAGVNTRAAGDTANTATTSVIQTSLSDANYLRVLNDVSGGPNADQRVFNQAMGNGNDVIDAGAGNDWVLAGGGNDTITGGTGSDVMWGGLGADRFQFNLSDLDGTIDTIKDFSFSQGDKLALRNFNGLTSDNLHQYVSLLTDASKNKTTLLIDQTGTSSFATPSQTIVLENSLEFPTLTQLKNAMVFVV